MFFLQFWITSTTASIMLPKLNFPRGLFSRFVWFRSWKHCLENILLLQEWYHMCLCWLLYFRHKNSRRATNWHSATKHHVFQKLHFWISAKSSSGPWKLAHILDFSFVDLKYSIMLKCVHAIGDILAFGRRTTPVRFCKNKKKTFQSYNKLEKLRFLPSRTEKAEKK